MELVNVICEGTMTAAAKIIADKKIVANVDALTTALRAQVLAGFDGLVAELKEASDCHMGEPMLRQIINVGCVGFAIAALKETGGM